MITYAVKKLTFSKKQLIPLILTPNGEKLKHLVNLAKEGKLKTVIDSKYPLSNAEDAWAKGIDGHATGKDHCGAMKENNVLELLRYLYYNEVLR
ncbi:hypothetical protein OIU85_002419 [Salix viminalis]|uniref:Uncharacterized protein n=1 Tax=Salix viminalis TaxID=40686 RepID=A0A9Q0VNC1_SALVM|nr:hypothetical protein OIU85_002419 [Salix viminalis]